MGIGSTSLAPLMTRGNTPVGALGPCGTLWGQHGCSTQDPLVVFRGCQLQKLCQFVSWSPWGAWRPCKRTTEVPVPKLLSSVPRPHIPAWWHLYTRRPRTWPHRYNTKNTTQCTPPQRRGLQKPYSGKNEKIVQMCTAKLKWPSIIDIKYYMINSFRFQCSGML